VKNIIKGIFFSYPRRHGDGRMGAEDVEDVKVVVMNVLYFCSV
jgi:hypothetical protein